MTVPPLNASEQTDPKAAETCPGLALDQAEPDTTGLREPSRFDVDVAFGPIDETYSASRALMGLLANVARLNDAELRFWCAMTVVVNLSSLSPCEEAEAVIIHVLGDAIAQGVATDGNYHPVLDASGNLSAILNDEDWTNPADEWEQLCFDAVNLSEVEARLSALIELAEICAITEANAAISDGASRHSLRSTPLS